MAIGTVCLGWEAERRRQLITAVDEIRNEPCSAQFNWEQFGPPYDPKSMLRCVWSRDAFPTRLCLGHRSGESTLIAVARLPTLQFLSLQGESLCNESLRHLEKLTSLKNLIIFSATRLDDGAIDHLRRLKTLRLFWIDESGMSPAGRWRLRMAMPDCYFKFVSQKGEHNEEYSPVNAPNWPQPPPLPLDVFYDVNAFE